MGATEAAAWAPLEEEAPPDGARLGGRQFGQPAVSTLKSMALWAF